ncbi:hypothetical protein [Rhodoferax sp.]|uniref:hypothetical protein n=1 Tax=Rhodoferax sp. TaxID=50421 RepID=UPI00351D28B7
MPAPITPSASASRAMALWAWVMARPRASAASGPAGQIQQALDHFLNLAFVPTFAVDVLAAYRQAVYDARS